MGYIEDIDAMELADDVKERLKSAHLAEVDPLRTRVTELRRDTKRDKVEEEVQALAKLGFEEHPGLLKYARRVLLSDADADPHEQPETVLLADHQLGLSGDQATGAHTAEPMTAAGVLRRFIELMPKNAEGKLDVKFSDQALAADDHGRPEGAGDGDDDDDSAKRRQSLARATGRPIPHRTRKRYGGAATVAGGDN